MKVIAHRGYSEKYTENTIEAFSKALEAGAKYIECDLQEVDGEFFIFHDWTLQRLAKQAIALQNISAERLSTLKLSSGHHIPRLQELAALVEDKATINLELKRISNVKAFVKQLSDLRQQFACRIVISSFDHHLLQQVQASNRHSRDDYAVQFAALIAHSPIDYAMYAHNLGCDIAAIDAHLCSQAFVAHAHELAMEVWAYTVNDVDLLFQLKTFGVDGVFTDRLEWALHTLQQAKV